MGFFVFFQLADIQNLISFGGLEFFSSLFGFALQFRCSWTEEPPLKFARELWGAERNFFAQGILDHRRPIFINFTGIKFQGLLLARQVRATPCLIRVEIFQANTPKSKTLIGTFTSHQRFAMELRLALRLSQHRIAPNAVPQSCGTSNLPLIAVIDD